MLGRHLTIFSTLSEDELAKRLEAHQEEFEIILGDTFGEDELEKFGRYLDALAEVSVWRVQEDLAFGDFLLDDPHPERLRSYFERCRACLVFENLPFLEDNPFQVTYLVDLLWSLEDGLVDRGEAGPLRFKKDFLTELKQLRGIDVFDAAAPVRPVMKAPPASDPVQALLTDVHRELGRLEGNEAALSDLSARAQRLLALIREREWVAPELLSASLLTPKDFGDTLERLKFFLKKL